MKKLIALPIAALCFAATAHAAGTVDASNSTITCNTILKGIIQPKPALVNGGLDPATIKIKGSLSGCTTNAPGVTSITGTFKGELTGGMNSCAGLVGPTTNTGTISVKWKATPALIDSTSTVTVNSGSSVGGLIAVGPGHTDSSSSATRRERPCRSRARSPVATVARPRWRPSSRPRT